MVGNDRARTQSAAKPVKRRDAGETLAAIAKSDGAGAPQHDLAALRVRYAAGGFRVTWLGRLQN